MVEEASTLSNVIMRIVYFQDVSSIVGVKLVTEYL